MRLSPESSIASGAYGIISNGACQSGSICTDAIRSSHKFKKLNEEYTELHSCFRE
jgi:hypothetical protein